MRLDGVKTITALFSSLVITLILTGCGGSSSSDNSPPTGSSSPAAVSIDFPDNNLARPLIERQSLTLNPNLVNEDGSLTATVNSDFEWITGDAAIATVSSDGVLAAVSTGTTTLTVSYKELSVDIALEVEPRILSSLELVLDPSRMSLGTSSTLEVFGIYNDESRELLDQTDPVSLETSNGSVAQIDSGIFGRIVGSGIGTAMVTASSASGLASSVEIKVTPALITDLMISSELLTVPAGYPVALSAMASYTDGNQREVTSDVAWSVSGVSNAGISSTGSFTSQQPGSAVVVAELGGESASLQIEITDAVLESIAVVAGNGSVAAGQSNNVSLRGTFSNGTQQAIDPDNWNTSDQTILTVDQNGLVVGFRLGTATISADLQGFSSTTDYEVTAALLEEINIFFPSLDSNSLAAGLQISAEAQGTFSDGTQTDLTSQVIWKSSDVDIAIISASGTVTAQAPGAVDITAAYQGTLGFRTLAVTDAVLQSVSIRSDSLAGGQISGAKGLIQPVALLGEFSDGGSSILAVGEVSWSLADTSIASINTNSEVQFLSVGATTITGQTHGFSVSIPINTIAAEPVAIDISGVGSTIAAGESATLGAEIIYSDSTFTDITDSATWSSSDLSIATVVDGGANNGQLRVSEQGFTIISAQYTLDGVSVTGTLELQVLPSTLRIEQFSDSSFDPGYSDCGSVGSSGGTGCTISSASSVQLLPAPTWFTLGKFRITAKGRDWKIGSVLITQFGSAATRVLGLSNGEIISSGSSIVVEAQIQSTNGIQESEIFSVEVITNNGSRMSAITGVYDKTTN
jgi:hypothetical protein